MITLNEQIEINVPYERMEALKKNLWNGVHIIQNVSYMTVVIKRGWRFAFEKLLVVWIIMSPTILLNVNKTVITFVLSFKAQRRLPSSHLKESVQKVASIFLIQKLLDWRHRWLGQYLNFWPLRYSIVNGVTGNWFVRIWFWITSIWTIFWQRGNIRNVFRWMS